MRNHQSLLRLTHRSKCKSVSRTLLRGKRLVVVLSCLFACEAASSSAQQPVPPSAAQRLDQLSTAIAQAQAQVDASQRQLEELKQQLTLLRQQTLQNTAQAPSPGAPPTADAASAPAVPLAQASVPQASIPQASTPQASTPEQTSEQQAMQDSQIATLDQEKVESESKYPVKLSGLILFNAFTNSGAVDLPATPTYTFSGQGSTGASIQQTLFGIDARGPNVFGATSRANARVDFYGAAAAGGASDLGGLVRLRTAQATLTWQHAEAFVSLDRPLISPFAPTSLTAVAVPALAWSGNLWVWMPQAGARLTEDLRGSALRARVEAALVDVPDPTGVTYATNTSLAEASRRPGAQLHLSLLGPDDERGAAIGVGGYFSPHRTASGATFNAWAATTDLRLPLGRRVQLSGSAYRGQALGGLGGGGYQDYVMRGAGDSMQFRALEDVGGWAQLKFRATRKLQVNTALGIDNVFAGQLRPYAVTPGSTNQNIARNRTVFSNAIFSPNSSLSFSFEYRYLTTAPVDGLPWNANVFGFAAGYRF